MSLLIDEPGFSLAAISHFPFGNLFDFILKTQVYRYTSYLLVVVFSYNLLTIKCEHCCV